MYSLYRAWLSMTPCSSMPTVSTMPTLPPPTMGTNPMPLNLSVPSTQLTTPDVTLQVGPTMTTFSAHKNILATHSGFFKAALATNGPGPILVPNVNVDEFSSLLTFMYTGYLDLNLGNIYNILLATHILHMPRALEICRSFLMQSHQPLDTRLSTVAPPHIIKPIASRKTVMPHQEFYQPIFSSLVKSEETPFKRIVTNESVRDDTAQASTSKDQQHIVKMEPEKQRPVKHKRRDLNNEKVIVDIACCDGPVRFHRVINKNYGLAQSDSDYTEDKVNRNDVMNKVMNESIRDKQIIDENNQQQSNSSEVYTCLYCNHTFKSQYCYQKHARRHLNPVVEPGKLPDSATTQREVKLLDMNVQYYPCKTCGSKFPSYYFVHKHRKMCHAEEMADNNNKNNEIVQVKQNVGATATSTEVEAAAGDDTQQSSCRTSIIDVEETTENN